MEKYTKDDRGIESWIETRGERRVAVAQAQVPGSDEGSEMLKYAEEVGTLVARKPGQPAPSRDDYAISRVKLAVETALDLINEHGLDEYRAAVMHH